MLSDGALLEESLVATRSRRANAGSRLKSLLQAEEIMNYNEEDENVDLLFQENGSDDEFSLNGSDSEGEEGNGEEEEEEEEEQNDDDGGEDDNGEQAESKSRKRIRLDVSADEAPEYNSDEMFSDSSEESTEEEEDQEAGEKELQKQERLKMRKDKKKKPIIPKINKPKDITAAKKPKKNPIDQIKADSLLSESRRSSTRRSAVQNKIELVNKLKESERRRASMKPKIQKEVHVKTQEERLAEALETEKQNIEALTRFKEQEIIKKQKRNQFLTNKKTLTDVIQFVTRIHLVTPHEEVLERERMLIKEKRKDKRGRKSEKQKQLDLEEVKKQEDIKKLQKRGKWIALGKTNAEVDEIERIEKEQEEERLRLEKERERQAKIEKEERLKREKEEKLHKEELIRKYEERMQREAEAKAKGEVLESLSNEGAKLEVDANLNNNEILKKDSNEYPTNTGEISIKNEPTTNIKKDEDVDKKADQKEEQEEEQKEEQKQEQEEEQEEQVLNEVASIEVSLEVENENKISVDEVSSDNNDVVMKDVEVTEKQNDVIDPNSKADGKVAEGDQNIEVIDVDAPEYDDISLKDETPTKDQGLAKDETSKNVETSANFELTYRDETSEKEEALTKNESSEKEKSLTKDNPIIKKVTFADEVKQEDEKPSLHNVRNEPEVKSELEEEQVEEPVYEGPSLQVYRNYISFENFQNPNVISTQKKIKEIMLGPQAIFGAIRRSNNVERVVHIKSVDADYNTTYKNNLFVPYSELKRVEFEELSKFPRLGVDDHGQFDKNKNDVKEEAAKEINIVTPAPSSIYMPSGVKKTCFITGKDALYFEPKTGIPYGSVEAYKVIDRIKQGEFAWCNFGEGNGAYVFARYGETKAAKGVPPGFLDV